MSKSPKTRIVFRRIMDSVSKETRSWMMSRIRSKDTKPELLVRSYLHKQGYRFRLHQKNLPGHPDIVLRKHNTCIFVNGCFWHRPLQKRCGNCRIPKTNKKFWKEKFSTNIKRDRVNLKKLQNKGWKCISLWECDLEDEQTLLGLKNQLSL